MRIPGAVRPALIVLPLLGPAWIASAQDGGDAGAMVARLGQRVLNYYQRAQRLVCLERSTVLPIDDRWRAQGMARTVESELRIEFDAADGESLAEPRLSRKILSVNGREPRARDLTDRSGCTDPSPISPEPLAFLLPGNRDGYTFPKVRHGGERDRAALVIDYASVGRRGSPQLIEDELGHDDCFDWEGPVEIKGRLWVDAVTYDVLKLERHIAGPTDVRVPLPLQRRYGFPAWVTIDREDTTLLYRKVAFTDPDEVMLLPESIHTTTVLRTGLQSTRRTQVFSDYRRFLTGSRIKRR
ncbi:MAG TPA: hypothetical protein VM791_09650 [Vicinamibacterales bacterium]|nr:hypothetical protein [Vicinamibacterales bacterium]